MKSSVFAILMTVLIAGCSTHHPDRYGVFHANNAHTGVYADSGYKNLGKLNWRFKTGGKIFSSPVILEGIAYVGSGDSNCYAINAATGDLKWKFHTGGAVSSSPAVFKQTAFFSSCDGNLYALDTETGKEIWKFKTGGEKKVGALGLWKMQPADMYMEDLWDFFISSPVINTENGVVYFGSSDSYIYAVDARTGLLIWKNKTNGIIHTTPALDKETIYVGSWDTYLYAFDAISGRELWKFKTREQPGYHVLEGIQASPTVSGGMVYFGARDGYFYALHASTGDTAWTFSADNSWILTTAAIRDSTIYFGTSDTYLLVALDAKTGKKKYATKASGYIYSSPAIAGNMLYYGDFTGNFYALDLNSTGRSWQTFSTESRKSNAARILNQKGELDFAFTAGTQDLALYASNVDVMNEFYTLGSIVSSPAISGNTVYFGSADGYLYALELKN